MRTVFFGASALGYKCCESLLLQGSEIVAIFTIPEQFNISYSPEKPVHNVLYKNFHTLGSEFNIPVFEVNQNIKDFIDVIGDLKPDFFLAIGWYYMIPNSILRFAKKGGAGLHASLLPKGRGNAPLVWSIINGEKETGVSLFYFSSGVDDGDIIAQKSVLIDENETIQTLLQKIEIISIEVVLKAIPEIAAGNAPRLKQLHENATYTAKRSPEDGLINWQDKSENIERFIRAQTKPYPGAFTIIEGKKVIIWDATIIDI